MSMTSHPLAFGTIEHTERAGELLGLLWQEVLRLQCDLKDERDSAERYRWLRQRYDVLCRMHTAQGLGLDLSAVYVRSAEQFDGVIDAAMRPHCVGPNVRVEPGP